MGILLTSMILNAHFFATAVYDTIYYNSTVLPISFNTFCDVNGFIAIFCEFIQTLYLISLCLHIVYSLRSNLKFKKMKGVILHTTFVILSAAATILFW